MCTVPMHDVRSAGSGGMTCSGSSRGPRKTASAPSAFGWSSRSSPSPRRWVRQRVCVRERETDRGALGFDGHGQLGTWTRRPAFRDVFTRAELQRALDADELLLIYQAQVDM